MRGLTFPLAALLLASLGATPAAARSPEEENAAKAAAAEAAEPAGKAAAAKSSPVADFAAVLGMIDKLFPAQPEPDPARLALARTSAQAIWPDGAYTRMMTELVGGIFDKAMQLKQSDLEGFGPEFGAKAAAAGNDSSLHAKALAKDPYFDQRVAAIRAAIDEEMAKVSAVLDPRMRDGLSRALARRFDLQQLTQINAFFATPAGQKFAGQYMQLWVDPDLLRSLFSSMPELMKLMPEATQKIKAAEEKYPTPAKAAEAAKPSAPHISSRKGAKH